ncbi:conserved exported hypothetical protein [Candidatus Sulfopaludibacter sp. SbA6]|nr:conserved exported hypothetical protein [Candidatus Sulfopaludibacter sp. SbA6]
MTVQLGILAGLIVLAAVVLGRLVSAWLKYRGRRVITCPENRRPAGVVVDAGHAAATALGKAPELRLSSCSRWPERAGCGQECLAQVAASPEDCLVRNILTRWYAGKVCASCGRPIGEIQWSGSDPALLQAGKISVAWSEVPADKLYEVLAASLPLCFACHMANTLVREHPELVVDRSSSHPI